jgi:hypothetical protein
MVPFHDNWEQVFPNAIGTFPHTLANVQYLFASICHQNKQSSIVISRICSVRRPPLWRILSKWTLTHDVKTQPWTKKKQQHTINALRSARISSAEGHDWWHRVAWAVQRNQNIIKLPQRPTSWNLPSIGNLIVISIQIQDRPFSSD